MRGAFLSVALESLTDHLQKQGLLTTVKPLEDKQWKELRTALRATVAAASAEWTEVQKKIISDRVNGLNSPTNADKLSQPFKALGIPLSEEDRAAILTRNTFLHEGRLLSAGTLAEDPKAWQHAYAIEMRIFTAINKLLLKYLGYTGPVIDWGGSPHDPRKMKFELV